MEFLEKMREIQIRICEFLDNEEDADKNFEDLSSLLTFQQNQSDIQDLKSVIYLISKISKNHHRGPFFIDKIKKIIIHLKEAIKQTFSNIEIFNFFKKNKLILLLLIEEEILQFDSIISSKIEKYKDFFLPEISKLNSLENSKENQNENQNDNQNENPKENLNENLNENQNENLNDNQNENPKENQNENQNDNQNENPKENQNENLNNNQNENLNENQNDNQNENPKENLNENLNENSNDKSKENTNGNSNENTIELPENYEEKRRKGENDSYLCEIIRNDDIEEFIIYFNKNNFSLSITIKPSIYETNSFLEDKTPTLIEYSTFFGSIQIIRFLFQNNVDLSPSLWTYAIHGQNAEIIHFLEENKVHPNDISYFECLKESIKCHHNDFAMYIKDNLFKELDVHSNYFEIETTYAFQFHNFQFIPTELNEKHFFYCAVEYNYYKLVEYYKNIEGLNINEPIIHE